MPAFVMGASSLKAIELGLIGNVRGKSILHLQCHFGQDSISLSRLGARVHGVDLSDKAIEAARELNTQCRQNAEFTCCNLYDLPSHLHNTFDIVFSTYGTIGWLPDIRAWASVVSHFLKPGGKFVFVEFHPMVWVFDNDFQKIAYRYFRSEAIVEEEEGSYTDRKADLKTLNVGWNHGLAEVMGALLDQGLVLGHFGEYDYSPYNCFRHTVETEPGKFRIAHLGDKIPMLYSLVFSKP